MPGTSHIATSPGHFAWAEKGLNPSWRELIIVDLCWSRGPWSSLWPIKRGKVMELWWFNPNLHFSGYLEPSLSLDKTCCFLKKHSWHVCYSPVDFKHFAHGLGVLGSIWFNPVTLQTESNKHHGFIWFHHGPCPLVIEHSYWKWPLIGEFTQ